MSTRPECPAVLERSVSSMLLKVLIAMFTCLTASAEGFQVYWNVPSDSCMLRGIDLQLERFGFTYNPNQEFHGKMLRIFYRPGHFPHVDDNGTTVNGGIPQRGSLIYHLSDFRKDILRYMPEPGATGPAVLDFEKWKPNFNGSPRRYRLMSWNHARNSYHGWLPWDVTVKRAEWQFEWAAKLFLNSSLANAIRLQPAAMWGYYQYPLCGNYKTPDQPCPVSVQRELEERGWLYGMSRALYPSIYLISSHSPQQRLARVRHHLDKAQGVAGNKPIYPYTWFQYHSQPDMLLNKTDLITMLGEPFARGLPAVVMWGASHNVDSAAKCAHLKEYLTRWLGPIVRHLVTMTTDRRKQWAERMRSESGRQLISEDIDWTESPVHTLNMYL